MMKKEGPSKLKLSPYGGPPEIPMEKPTSPPIGTLLCPNPDLKFRGELEPAETVQKISGSTCEPD